MAKYFDDILKDIGQFGRYQRTLFCMIGLITMHGAMQAIQIVFVGAEMKFRCASNGNESESWAWRTTCKSNTTGNGDVNDSCENMEFDKSVFKRTIRSEWRLVCDRDYMVALVQTLYMAGWMVGTAPTGYLSDRYGRKRLLIICLLVQSVVNSVAAYLPNYILFILFRFISGSLAGAVSSSSFVLLMEFVGPSVRSYMAIWIDAFYSVGMMLLTGISYILRDHQQLQLTLGLLPLLFVVYYWIIPESPRWLLSVNRVKEAEVIMRKIARINGKEVANDVDIIISPDLAVKSGSIMDVIKMPYLRRMTMISCYNWFVVSLVYFGIVLGEIGGNVFLNLVLSALSMFPSYIAGSFVINRMGRTTFLATTTIISGFCSLGASLLVGVTHLHWLLVILSMLGLSCITNSFVMLYLYSVEIFPTVARNAGLGLCSTFARVGGLLAPQIARIDYVWSVLPFLILALLSVTSGIMTLFLPETFSKRLPETMEEGEELAKTYGACCTKRNQDDCKATTLIVDKPYMKDSQEDTVLVADRACVNQLQ